MDRNLFILFVVLNVLNVIMQTVKSLATYKCGKGVASLVNAVAYGLYQVILVYAVCDLPLWTKVIVVALANLVGVYVVKYGEEKMRKDKLWLVKITVPNYNLEKVKQALSNKNIPFTYYDVTKYGVFDTFCETQKETLEVIEICKNNNGKMFASENKLNL